MQQIQQLIDFSRSAYHAVDESPSFQEHSMFKHLSTLAGSLLLFLSVGAPAISAARQPDIAADRWIVILDDAPTTRYAGTEVSASTSASGWNGKNFVATAPAVSGKARLDPDSDAVRAYADYLDDQRGGILAAAGAMLGRSLQPEHVYRHVLNGFSARMSATEAKALSQLPGILSVQADVAEYIRTDAGPAWIGAPTVWFGGGGLPSGNKGEGMVLGVVDTGINWDSVFFDAAVSAEPALSNPRPAFLGLCSDPEVQCSGKLIGVYDFTDEGTKGKDPDNHGSHVAATAAGYPLTFSLDFDGAGPVPSINFSTSGVAPRASIVSYKACKEVPDEPLFQCFFSDTGAALERAILDGVDVVNYSIGGGPSDPWSGFGSSFTTTAEVMFNMREAGIFVSVAAGNDGPVPESVGSPANAPWVFAVANTSHARAFINRLTDATGGTFALGSLDGQALSSSLVDRPIVHAADFGNALCGTGPAELGGACGENTGASNPFPPGTFNGEIVVCDSGVYGSIEKGFNVLAAGAGGMILANTAAEGDSVSADLHCLPATHVGATDGDRLRDWLASGSNHRGRLAGTVRANQNSLGGLISGSSSRGPAFGAPDVMKPNAAAPGTSILAAGAESANSIVFLSGTSMAAPHVAGAGLLVRKAHPSWGVSEVTAALETTADASVNSLGPNVAAATVDRGAGNVRVDQAVRIGLYLPVSGGEFEAANPALGGVPGNLNLPGIVSDRCEGQCSFSRTVRALTSGSWTVSTEGDLSISVSPSSFSLGAGQQRTLQITLQPGQLPAGIRGSGSVVLTPSSGTLATQRLPVGALFTGGELPEFTSLVSAGNRGRGEIQIPSLGATDELVVRTSELVRPNPFIANLVQDPTPLDPFDGGPGTRISTITVPPSTLLLHVETFASSSNDVDLFVGRDLDNNGQPDAAELVCRSVTETDLERCQIENPEAGTWWVVVQNWSASPSAPDVIRYEVAVLSESSESSLVSFGPGLHDGGPLTLPVYWDQPAMLRDERRIGAIGIATSRDFFANVGSFAVAVTRNQAAQIDETAIFPGRDDRVMVPAGGRHNKLYLDVPETATAIQIDIFGQSFDAQLGFADFDDLVATIPSTPAAPEPFIGGSEAISGGRRLSLSASPGQTLAAGRYFIVIDNQDSEERSYLFSATVTEDQPVDNIRGLWGPLHRTINQGIDWQIGGGGNFAVWYTYDEDGLPTFYISNTVPPVDGSSIYNAILFRATSNDQRNFLTPVGEVQITSVAPGRLMYAWRLNGNHGSEMYRTNIDSSCPLIGGVPSQRTGHWVSPDTSAGGVTLLSIANAEAWIRYYYDNLNRPRWVLADEELPPTLPDGVSMEVLDFRGFCIYCDPSPISREVVGTLERQFIDSGTTREVSDFLAGPPINASVQNDRAIVRATFTPACSNQ